jgi:hypothetical protein
VTGSKGKRHSIDAAFLDKRKSNLHIVTHATVEKVFCNTIHCLVFFKSNILQILFTKGKRAFGVKFRHFDQIKYAYATKEVISSAGAIGSPHLLMVSGIGPKEHLKQHGVSKLIKKQSFMLINTSVRLRLSKTCQGSA